MSERKLAQSGNGQRSRVLFSLLLFGVGLVTVLVVGILVAGLIRSGKSPSLWWAVRVGVWGAGAIALGFLSAREVASRRTRLLAMLWILLFVPMVYLSNIQAGVH